MKYSIKFAPFNSDVIDNIREYVYDDVPYTIDRVYKNLTDRLKNVRGHYMYNANDKVIIDINDRVIIKLKEYAEGLNCPSGYFLISLKSISKDVATTKMTRIPRNNFELYTLITLVQSIIDCEKLKDAVDIINNTDSILTEYETIPAFYRNVIFDITQSGKKYIMRPRIEGCDVSEEFDDIDDYRIVLDAMYKSILTSNTIAPKLLSMFDNILFEITVDGPVVIYTSDYLKISYVGPHNIEVTILDVIKESTVIDNCKETVISLLNRIETATKHLFVAIR